MENENIGGWAVAVRTKRLGGGNPLLELYAASFSDVESAISLVKARCGILDEDVGEAYPLAKETIQALGMDPGEVDPL